MFIQSRALGKRALLSQLTRENMANVPQMELPFAPGELEMIGSFEQLKLVEPKYNPTIIDWSGLQEAGVIRGFSDLDEEMQGEAKLRWQKLIEFLYPIVDVLFPEAWDFHVEPSYRIQQDENGNDVEVFGAKGTLTLYYPHVTILSRKGIEYPITDLYVRVFFNEQCNITGSVHGTRGSLKAVEYVGSYVHSHLTHLNKSGRDNFTHFCQGSTLMRDLITRLSVEEILDEDNNPIEEAPMLFEAFLHQLGAYVSHEAKDGNPYMYIHAIGTGANTQPVTDEDNQRAYQNFKNYCRAFRYTPELFIDRGEVKIKENDPNFERVLLTVTQRLQYKNAEGGFYEDNLKLDKVPSSNPNFRAFTFRNQTITQKIIKDGQEQKQEQRQQYCHRQIKNYIINVLQSEIAAAITEQGKQHYYERVRAERAQRISSAKLARSNNGKAHHKTKRFFESLVPIIKDGQEGMVGSDVLQGS